MLSLSVRYSVSQSRSWKASDCINKKLRTEYLTDKDNKLFTEIERRLNLILDRINSHNNTTVYRDEFVSCTKKFEDVHEWFDEHIGAAICFPSFLSCSEHQLKNRELLFNIQTSDNSNARDITSLVHTNSEREILFKSKTVFQIVEVREEKKEVFLKETKESPDISIYQDTEYHEQNRGENSEDNLSLTEQDLI